MRVQPAENVALQISYGQLGFVAEGQIMGLSYKASNYDGLKKTLG